MNTWADPYNWTLLAVFLVLGTGAVMRIRAGLSSTTNRKLLAAHLAMVIAPLLANSVVYYPLDQLLGAKSYANLVVHGFVILATWLLSISVLASMTPERRPWWAAWWVPVAVIALSAVAFVILDPHSDRGLVSYQDHPAYVAYWLATLAIIPLAMPQIVRGLSRWFQGEKRAIAPTRYKVGAGMLIYGYIAGSMATLFYAITAVFPSMVFAREFLGYSAILTLAAGLMVTPSAPQRREAAQWQRADRAQIQR